MYYVIKIDAEIARPGFSGLPKPIELRVGIEADDEAHASVLFSRALETQLNAGHLYRIKVVA